MSWPLGKESGPLGPYKSIKSVSPSDSADLPDGMCQALYCSGAGNVVIVTENGEQVTLAISAGWANIVPILIRRVRNTSTTATGILALYV
jgi:hypothetical protein